MKEESDITRSLNIIPAIIKKYSYPSTYNIHHIKNSKNKEKTISALKRDAHEVDDEMTIDDITSIMNKYIVEEESKMAKQKNETEKNKTEKNNMNNKLIAIKQEKQVKKIEEEYIGNEIVNDMPDIFNLGALFCKK